MTTTPLRRTVVDVVGIPFHAIWSPLDGAVLAAGFATENDPEAHSLAERLGRLDPDAVADGIAESRDDELPIARTLRAYAAGDLRAIDALAVRQPETPFRGEVWRALREVAPGEAVTYTELASIAGRPSAIRAAASGCANNLVALIVPCHRIIRRDGGLGGYLFGTETKELLLQHEGAWQPDLIELATSRSPAE